MKWPPWSDITAATAVANDSRRFTFCRRSYTFSELVAACATVGASALVVGYVYRNYCRRIPTAAHVAPHFLRRRSLLGHVTSVGDGDNFRIFHTPGGRLAGWGWLPGRRIPTVRKDLKDQTVHIRIAGIDAPECAHFGNPQQPYSREALDWLRDYVGGRRVRVNLHSKDQFDRVVASVKIWRGLWRRDVGLEMLRAGMATLYEAKIGAEFGGLKRKYVAAEERAKKARVGLWREKKVTRISPAAFKKGIRERQAA